jgi:type IV pilus assembly protein PilB
MKRRDLTFDRGLRSILRHDLTRSWSAKSATRETAQIAIQSALTGHLVFTTVHAKQRHRRYGRFLNMGVEPYNFVSSLNCVLAQRLIRMLCPYCKRQYQPNDVELSESGLQT